MPPKPTEAVVKDESAPAPALSLTVQEIAAFRTWNEIRKRKDPDFSRQETLLDDQRDMHEIVEGKRASLWIWKTVGALAKYVALVAGGLAAYKGFLAWGQKP